MCSLKPRYTSLVSCRLGQHTLQSSCTRHPHEHQLPTKGGQILEHFSFGPPKLLLADWLQSGFQAVLLFSSQVSRMLAMAVALFSGKFLFDVRTTTFFAIMKGIVVYGMVSPLLKTLNIR